MIYEPVTTPIFDTSLGVLAIIVLLLVVYFLSTK